MDMYMYVCLHVVCPMSVITTPVGHDTYRTSAVCGDLKSCMEWKAMGYMYVCCVLRVCLLSLNHIKPLVKTLAYYVHCDIHKIKMKMHSDWLCSF